MAQNINRVIGVLFMLCYAYQFFYMFAALVKRPRHYAPASCKRYAVMIAARNEEPVIGNLIRSIKAQRYPAGLVDIFVVADNCTDGTFQAAVEAGARVFIRRDTERVGKGYALHFLFERVLMLYPDRYDGFFIFDADNLLDADYIARMNDCFAAGYEAVTSYRNSKNYGDNWISAGYALWFLREAQYLNNPRSLLGTSCAVSGTGFLVSRELIEKNGGWPFFLLTEDIEFTADCVINGVRIGYCGDAVLYDEQPVSFSQSWKQRMRWAKGYLQVFGKYGGRLIRGILSPGCTSCFDMTMNIMPAIVLTLVSAAVNAASLTASVIAGKGVREPLLSVLGMLAGTYLLLFVIGAVTGVTEWRRIHCPAAKKVLSFFTFPLFMLTYIPISAAALFRPVAWSPIKHTCAMTIQDINRS